MVLMSSINSAVHRFMEKLLTLPVDHSLDISLENATLAEHELRLLFGAGHKLPDFEVGLINLFNLPPAARRTRSQRVNQSDRNFDRQYIFPLPSDQRREQLTSSTVLNIEAFQEHWKLFTHGSLSSMRAEDWQNVIVAGGSVLACLMAPSNISSSRRLNEYFQSEAYASSDIDLFIWGLNAEQAQQKMKNIYRAVCAAAPWKVTCVRKANTVSIHTSYPFRPIQIVLRLYQSPAEILTGFDVDAGCCAYDGVGKVWVNPRALAAIVRQANTVDITRRSPSYESRLAKYAQRGFEIYLPSLDRERIRPTLYLKELQEFPNGLARLLVLEAAFIKPDTYDALQYKRAGPIPLPQSNYESEFRWAQIPYGPSWDATRIKKMIIRKDAWMNSPQNPLNADGQPHKHVFFAGNMRQCLNAFCEDCVAEDIDDSDAHEIFIRGPLRYGYIHLRAYRDCNNLRFITTNPGGQLMTGSFRPIEIGNWAHEAYIDQDEVAHNNRRLVIIDSDDEEVAESEDEEGSDYSDAVSHSSRLF